MEGLDFIAERISKSATISVDANIEKVFPLFGAFEEKKWANKWSPILIYPGVEHIDEGTSFKTNGHGYGEKQFLWIVVKYQLREYLVQYLVSSENRYWTITIKCRPFTDLKTVVEITYAFTGLNNIGNQINIHALKTIYHKELKDWERSINYYLSTGKLLPE